MYKTCMCIFGVHECRTTCKSIDIESYLDVSNKGILFICIYIYGKQIEAVYIIE